MQVDDIFGESAVTFGSPLADLSGIHETTFQFEGIHRNVEPNEVCSISDLDHAHLEMSKDGYLRPDARLIPTYSHCYEDIEEIRR